jgi:hypothetical protein
MKTNQKNIPLSFLLLRKKEKAGMIILGTSTDHVPGYVLIAGSSKKTNCRIKSIPEQMRSANRTRI